MNGEHTKTVESRTEKTVYACGTCGKPIKTGCYCSDECANAEDSTPENLTALVNAIPSGGEWWKSSTGYTYQQAAKKLVELGMPPTETANFLSDLFNAASEEFGA